MLIARFATHFLALEGGRGATGVVLTGSMGYGLLMLRALRLRSLAEGVVSEHEEVVLGGLRMTDGH